MRDAVLAPPGGETLLCKRQGFGTLYVWKHLILPSSLNKSLCTELGINFTENDKGTTPPSSIYQCTEKPWNYSDSWSVCLMCFFLSKVVGSSLSPWKKFQGIGPGSFSPTWLNNWWALPIWKPISFKEIIFLDHFPHLYCFLFSPSATPIGGHGNPAWSFCSIIHLFTFFFFNLFPGRRLPLFLLIILILLSFP